MGGDHKGGFYPRKIFWIPVLAALLLVVIVFMLLPRGPRYEGKPLSYWLDQLPAVILSGSSEARMIPGHYRNQAEVAADTENRAAKIKAAEKAVDAIGLQCLPELAARLRYKTSPWKVQLMVWCIRLHIKQVFEYPDDDRIRGQAVMALLQLGPRAHDIVPELLTMANDPDPRIKALARRALRDIAPAELRKLNAR